MLLTIDVGNTNCVFAVFDQDRLIGKWRLATVAHRTSDEYGLALRQLLEHHHIAIDAIDAVIIASVVPPLLFTFKALCKHYLHCTPLIIGDEKVALNIAVSTDVPNEVGADRLVNAVAAYHRYGGSTLIIDFGTATNFDIINEEGDYIGGVIAPGINLSLDALHQAAAKLPKIAIKRPPSVIGSNTIHAMQSGIYWGYIGLIEGFIERITHEYGSPLTTIATGGLAPLFMEGTSMIDHLEKDLTLYGLKMIHDLNKIH